MILMHCLLCQALTVDNVGLLCVLCIGDKVLGHSKFTSSWMYSSLPQNNYSTGIIHLSELGVDNSSLL